MSDIFDNDSIGNIRFFNELVARIAKLERNQNEIKNQTTTFTSSGSGLISQSVPTHAEDHAQRHFPLGVDPLLLDEDDMVSNSATLGSSQQAIKALVDNMSKKEKQDNLARSSAENGTEIDISDTNDNHKSISCQVIANGTVTAGIVIIEGTNKTGTKYVPVMTFDSLATSDNLFLNTEIEFDFYRYRISSAILGGGTVDILIRLIN